MLVVVFALVDGLQALIGCSLNALLAFTATVHSRGNLHVYAILVVAIAVLDFTICALHFVVQQRSIPLANTLLSISHGPCTSIGPYFCYFCYSIIMSNMSYAMNLLLLSFVYRDFILRRAVPTWPTLVFWMLVFYVPSLIQLVALLVAYGDPQKIYDVLKTGMPEYIFPGMTVTGIEDLRSPAALLSVSLNTFGILPLYTALVFFGFRIVRFLANTTSSMSDKTKAMHKQLLIALALQACLPAFSLVSCGLYEAAELGFIHFYPNEYLSTVLSVVISMLRPLSTLYFVKPYWEATTTMLRWRQSQGATASLRMETTRPLWMLIA